MASRCTACCFLVLVMMKNFEAANAGTTTPSKSMSPTGQTTTKPSSALKAKTINTTPAVTIPSATLCTSPGACTKGTTKKTSTCTGPSCVTVLESTSPKEHHTTVPSICVGHNCSGHGKCRAAESSFKCDCAPGYDGQDCGLETLCLSQPCQNGGACSGNTTDYACNCASAYSGENCSQYNGAGRTTKITMLDLLLLVVSTTVLI